MTLEKYNKKRDFNKTSEPKGIVSKQSEKKKFVIQYHRARSEHYDFRLEHKGVLVSFAVPKGLSNNPNVKRLAVNVEDHPLDYANFEGVIPKGNYGAGTVEIFDGGYYQAVEDFDKGYKKGHIKIVLYGERFKGGWSLIKTEYKNWLIVKAKDEYVKAKDNVATIQKIPFKKAEPMLAQLSNEIPKGKNWIFEIKYDGYRILSFIENGKVKLYSRNYNEYSEKFSQICKSLQIIAKKTSMVLDGEVVCFDKDGRSDFGLLQQNIKTKKGGFVYVVFDILAFNGEDLREKSLKERKYLLEKVLTKSPKNIIYSSFVVGKGKESFNFAKELNLEGIVAKKFDSKYKGERNGEWLKIKCYKRQEFVIGGYTISSKNEILSAILVGYFKGKDFIYIGKVGTGFDEKTKSELISKFKKLKQNESSFINCKVKDEQTIYLKPEIVCEIKYAEITKEQRLRQPSFVGLRADKDSKNVVLEGENEN